MENSLPDSSNGDHEAFPSSFRLCPDDLALIYAVRGDARRLARALLLVWARAERIIAPDPSRLPAQVIALVAAQLQMNPEVLERYKNWPAIHTADTEAVQSYLGLRPFSDQDAQQLRAFLAEQTARTGNAAALLEAADVWLARQRLLRPRGKTTIERLVYQTRSEAERALFATVADQLTQAQRDQLDALCQGGQGGTMLGALTAPSRVPSSTAIREECHRLALVQTVLPAGIDWGPVTPARRAQWAAIVKRLTAQAVRRYPPEKRYTLLLAFLAVRGEELTDSVVDMFDALIDRVFARSAAELTEARLEQTQAQLASARFFRGITQVLLDPAVPDERVRSAIFQRVPRERVSALVEQSQSLDQSEAERLFTTLRGRFTQTREFTPMVFETLHFEAACANHPVLAGVETLRAMNKERRKKVPDHVPLGFVPQRWMSVVARPDGIDRRAWELTLLFELRLALRAGELTVQGSRRYARWDSALHTPNAWEERRAHWFAERGLPQDGAAYLAQAKAEVHALAVEVAGRWPENTAARVEGGRLMLAAPARVQTALATEQVRRALVALLPRASLADVLIEVDHWTRFTSAFAHLAERQKPTEDKMNLLRPALFAVLAAEATNLGLPTMAAASGISYGRLARVYDWYVREETLRQAIRLLIHYQQNLPLAMAFGSGTTSLASTLHFGLAPPGARVARASLDSWRGVQLPIHLSGQGAPFWLTVASPLVQENCYTLDGLISEQFLPIREQSMDTAGTIVNLLFGLSELLGYRFTPHLRDLPDQLLARVGDDPAYGALGPVLRCSLREPLILSQWDEMNRLAASLKDQLLLPSLVIARFQGMRQPCPLQQAIQEVGCLAKTRHILRYIDDAALRRRVQMGLSKGERLQAMARALFFGQQERFNEYDYEAQRTQALALNLVMAAIIVWNTRYLGAAANALARRGQPVPEEVWADLSPILWEHLSLVGKFSFDGG